MLKVQTHNAQTSFRPGDPIQGSVDWKDVKANRIEVRLFWFTEGKGDQDVDVIDTQTLESPTATGNLEFRFTAPPRPQSFSGKLISLTWAIEAVIFPKRDAERVEIEIGPQGQQVRISGGAGAE